MLLYDVHKCFFLFFLFHLEFFSVLLTTNIFVILIEKNVPWHILAPRAVACENLHLRACAHLWHVSAFSYSREFLGIFCYIKNNPPEQIRKICFRGYHKGSIPNFFLLYDLTSVRRHLKFRSEHFTRTAAHEHAL